MVCVMSLREEKIKRFGKHKSLIKGFKTREGMLRTKQKKGNTLPGTPLPHIKQPFFTQRNERDKKVHRRDEDDGFLDNDKIRSKT